MVVVIVGVALAVIIGRKCLRRRQATVAFDLKPLENEDGDRRQILPSDGSSGYAAEASVDNMRAGASGPAASVGPGASSGAPTFAPIHPRLRADPSNSHGAHGIAQGTTADGPA